MASTAKKGAKRVSIAAATMALCVNMGMSAKDIEAAQAAMHDIAAEEGTAQARAIIISMERPFGGFYA